MSEGTVRLISDIRRRIRLLSRRMTVGRLLYGVALFLGLLSTGIILAVGLEALLWMATAPRTAILWLLISAAIVAALVLVVPPLAGLAGLRSGPDEQTVARAVGQRFPDVADRLLDLLQLATGQGSEAPTPLIDGAVAQLGRRVSSVDYMAVEDFDDFRRAGRLARWPVLGLIAFALIVPSTFRSAAERLMKPGTVFMRPPPFTISVEPGDVRLVKGDSLAIEAWIEGGAPERVTLSMRRTGETRLETVSLGRDSLSLYTHVISSVRDGFQYFVEAGEVVSPTYRVDVSGRPFVRSMQMTVTPPAYTRLAVRRLAADIGDVSALAGSRVDLELDLGGEEITDGNVQFDGGATVPIEIDGDGMTGRATFDVVRDDKYRVVLNSASGVANENPIEYRVRVTHDQRPAIFVLRPEPSSEFDEDLDVDVSARITDDFGFSGMSLFYRLAESRFGDPQEHFIEVALPKPEARELDQQIDFRWPLSEAGLDLVPGDVVTFYLEVRDNDAVSGNKSAASGLHTIRFPSLTDKLEAVNELQDDLERSLESLLHESSEIEDAFRELRDELRKDQEGGWDDERMVDRIQERQRRLDEQIGDLAQKMESLVEEMAEDNLMSQETIQKFQELKRVVEEINSPELQEALERLKEAMRELDLTEMQNSLGEFEFNEDQFRERIERALELFKRLRTEQQLEEAARRAEDLSEREKQLSERTEQLASPDSAEGDMNDEEPQVAEEDSLRTPGAELQQEEGREEDSSSGDDQDRDGRDASPPDPEQLAAEQERAADEMKRLEDLMERIREQMEEFSPAPTDEMQDLLDQAKQQDFGSNMRENAQDLRNREFQQAQRSQQEMQQSLQQLSERLKNLQQQMSGAQLTANLAALRRALDDVLTLSLEEENLRDDVRDLATRDAGLRSFTQQQAELLDGLHVVGDTLSRLARAIPEMSRQIQAHAGEASMDMERAVEEMTERRGQQALGHQKSAMTNLNELALMLSDLMQNLQAQQAGMAGMSMQQMMQQLGQMIGDQGRLNEQIQQFLNDMQGSRLSQDMQARLQQMAAQQEALKRQLEEMSNSSSGQAEKLLGDLEKVARQMEESISEMRSRNIDRRTQERQREILTRLLNAQRSIRERGTENQREGRTAGDLERASPSDLTPNERAERLRRELLRALESGYAPDYEELIRRYFEALQLREDTP